MGLNGNNTVELGKRFDINKDVGDNLAMLRGKDNGNLDYNGKFDLSQSMEVNSDSVDTSEKETFNSPLPDAQPMSTAERLAFQTEMDLNSPEGPKKVTETMIKCLKNVGDPESTKLLNEMIKNPKIFSNLTAERIKKLSPEQRGAIVRTLGTAIVNTYTIVGKKNKEGKEYYEINTKGKETSDLMAYYQRLFYGFFSGVTSQNGNITRYDGSNSNSATTLSSEHITVYDPQSTTERNGFVMHRWYDLKGIFKGYDSGIIQRDFSNLSDILLNPNRLFTNEDPNNYYCQSFQKRKNGQDLTKGKQLSLAYNDEKNNTDTSS